MLGRTDISADDKKSLSDVSGDDLKVAMMKLEDSLILNIM